MDPAKIIHGELDPTPGIREQAKTHLCHSTINFAVMHNERLTQLW
jgi:hypothetical protein